jgi:gamma-glutamyl AIG2-like cyclotransferase
MTDRPIEVFFYGLFMDASLLRSKGIVPLNPRPATVEGFGLRIGKRATLVPARHERSYGMVMGLTHQELKGLYSGPGLEHYRPEAVTCTTLDGELVSALCYNLPKAPAPDEVNEEYAGQLRAVLAKLGFPAEYVERVR